MSHTAQRVAFHGPQQIVVEPFTLDEPGQHEILVQTTHSLVSAGTEMSNRLGQLSVFRGYPVYPGYSNVGIVTATGQGVEQPHVGQRIVSMGRHASHFKLNLDPLRPGGPDYWQPVPDAVSSPAATFAVLGSVALHSMRKASLQIGEAVVIVGAGVVGQLLTQFAYWSGCHPVMTLDLFDRRLEYARQSGANLAVNPKTTDAVAAVRASTDSRGADVVFEGTRTAQTLPLMMKLAAQSGRIMIVGSLPGSVEIDPFSELQLKELQIIGCFQPAAPIQGHAYFPWTQQRNRRIVLELIAAGKLRVEHLITHQMPYTAAADAYAMMSAGGDDWLGVIFEW